MKILFYYPSNKRTVSLETLIIELNKKHQILLLTTCEKGDFHTELENNRIRTFSNSILKKNVIIYYFKQIIFLIKFCRFHNINVVFSHLQNTNLIAVIAQYFIKSRLIVFRHHFKFSTEKNIDLNKNEQVGDILINKLAKMIVVPSSGVYNGMKESEKVNISKVKIIPYVYDFSKYASPNIEEVNKIKHQFPCNTLLIMCSRLIPLKRHNIVFPVIAKLIKEGYDIKMLVLDEGPEKQNLEEFIQANNLQSHILMLGFRRDFINYMSAAQLLIHPSLTEASNSVVKEMGLLRKAVAVCEGVGDFDDYIVGNVNGFLLPKINPGYEIEEAIKFVYHYPLETEQLGINLKNQVLERFNLSPNIINEYDHIIS